MLRSLALFATLLAAAPVGAAELVTNGDFETSGFGPSNPAPGWSVTGAVGTVNGPVYAGCCAYGSEPGFSANHFLAMSGGNFAGLNALSQSLITVAGRAYHLRFSLGALYVANVPRTTDLTLDAIGSHVGATYSLPGNDNLDTGFRAYSLDFTATAPTTLLRFSAVTVPDYIDQIVDNVSVSSTVPEPASWTLFVAGFGLTGVAIRRRQTALAS